MCFATQLQSLFQKGYAVTNTMTNKIKSVVIGCGDVGQRLVKYLLKSGELPQSILVTGRKPDTLNELRQSLGVSSACLDLDESPFNELLEFESVDLYYLAPPQSNGLTDLRSTNLITALNRLQTPVRRMLLVGTTGVYGDCQGAWVDESSACQPINDRSRRRLDAEQQWQRWAKESSAELCVFRVVGIYAHERLSRKRFESALPVIRATESGFSNRIHADDLARLMAKTMQHPDAQGIFNIADGRPTSSAEFQQYAAKLLGYPPLPEISMQQALEQFSPMMLSFIKESKRVNADKLLALLNMDLLYPDYKTGLLH